MLKASVWLVSNVACEQSIHSIHTEVRGSRGALHAGACVAGALRSGGGGTAVHGSEVEESRAEQALAWP